MIFSHVVQFVKRISGLNSALEHENERRQESVMKLKLTPRLTVVFILFALALLIGVGTLVYNSGRSALQAAATTELQATSNEKYAALDAWITEREADLTALANSPYILRDLDTFLKSEARSATAHEELVRALSVNTGEEQSFLSLFILSAADGSVLISTDPKEEGQVRADRSYFKEGKAGTYTTPIHYSDYLQAPSLITVAPLKTADGQLLGILAGRLDLNELNVIIQRRSGLHETDDSFLVNSSNLFVTQPRFLPDPAVLQVGVHTVPVLRCLEGGTDTISSLDYRGVPVIASYRWIPQRQMCLIVKISQEEALAPVFQFRKAIVWITLGALWLASLIALYLSRALLRPIQAMQRAAQRYGSGSLDTRLPETRHDELGVLAHEFNQMAASLAEKELQLLEHTRTLEQKVQERTKALQESEDKFKYIFDHSIVGKSITFPDGTLGVNKSFCTMLGYSAEELANKKWHEITHPEDVELTKRVVAPLYSGEKDSVRFIKRYLHKNGSVVWADVSTVLRRDHNGNPIYFITGLMDITERKVAEARIHDLLEFNEKILHTAPIGILTYRISGECIFANEIAASITGTTPEKLATQNFHTLESWKKSGLHALVEQAIATKVPVMADVHHISTFGKESWLTANAVTFKSKEEEQVLLTISEITERKRMEEALRESEEHYRLLFEQVRHGFALHEVVCNEAGEPVDYRYLEANPAFETLTGLRAADLIGRTVREVLPNTEDYWVERFGHVALTGEPVEFNNYSQELGKYYEVSAYSPRPRQFAVIFSDVTERKRAEQAIQQMTEDLRRSNAELEQFAYVASHDLQEPLRMVSSYVQLLARRYQGKLDKDADDFIAYAVDGAKRMQNLINDLLAYSRVGTRSGESTSVSAEALLGEALSNLQFMIQETGAKITHEQLPMVKGDRIQLTQVFQNLIGNAIKFHGPESPCIHVSACQAQNEWVFSVRDNGIGIDPKFAERIFIIFQRLNDRTQYPGTGIGLAICKRIVLRHGGRIWVESEPGKGSVFYFSLPLCIEELN